MVLPLACRAKYGDVFKPKIHAVIESLGKVVGILLADVDKLALKALFEARGDAIKVADDGIGSARKSSDMAACAIADYEIGGFEDLGDEVLARGEGAIS